MRMAGRELRNRMASTRASHTMVPAVPAIMYSSGRCGLGSTRKISETSATQADSAADLHRPAPEERPHTHIVFARPYVCQFRLIRDASFVVRL
jgi:hypothetical protein